VKVTDAPFDLSEAKLAPSSTRPGTVAKSDVIEDLCASRAPLVTVVAPAGYGKTTILARWAEADPRPFAWVALDPRDDDPVVLLRYVAGAMHRIEPLPPEVFDALSGAGGSGWTKRVARLGNALEHGGKLVGVATALGFAVAFTIHSVS
jgi:LuxR family maltose regulon positive regulatory protein